MKRRRKNPIARIAVFTAAMIGVCSARTVAPAMQDIGPPGGWAIALAPDSHKSVFVGYHGGGIVRLEGSSLADRGAVGPDERTVVSIAGVPGKPKVLYAGTEKGLYLTQDAGRHWLLSDTGLNVHDIWSILADPESPDTVYLGSAGGGVYKTTDGAQHWTHLEDTGTAVITSLAFSSGEPKLLYATALYGGILSSADNGAHWKKESGVEGLSVFSLAVDDARSGKIFAGAAGGVFSSVAGSGTWQSIEKDPAHGTVYSLALDRKAHVLYAGGTQGLLCSKDAGASWESVSDASRGMIVWSLALDPQDANRLYLGTLGNGLQVSTDQGKTLQAVRSPSGHPIVHTITVDSAQPGTLYGGTAGGGVFKSSDRGKQWMAASHGLADPIVNGLTTDPALAGVVYAATQKQFLGAGGGVFKSTDGGTTWANVATSKRRVFCVHVVSGRGKEILAGSDGGVILASEDDGAHWRQAELHAAGVVPSNSAVQQSMHPGAVFAIADGGTAGGPIYAGTSTGLFKSVDHAASWIGISQGLGDTRIRSLAVDPTDPRLVYVGTGDESAPGAVYKTKDAGATWEKTTLTGRWVLSLLARGSSLYAGTDNGVYASKDGGLQWTHISDPALAYVLTLAPGDPQEQELYAGTEGQGIIRINDHGLAR